MSENAKQKQFPWFSILLFLVCFAFACLLYLWKRKIVYGFAPFACFLLISFYRLLLKSKKKSKEAEEDE